MSKKQSDKAIVSWSKFRIMLTAIFTLLILVVMAGGIFFFDIIYTTLFPPVSSYGRIPIDLTKANSFTMTPIQINYNRKYNHFQFVLEFKLEGEKDRHSPAYPEEKRKQLAEFIGWTDHGPGVKVPMRLTVSKKHSGNQVICREKVYITEGCRSMGSDDFHRQITVINMLPGDYSVKLENLKEIERVPEGITVALRVIQAGHK